LLSKDVEGLPAFWTKAKYGKMSIEGRDPVNTETPHYGEAGAVDDRKILVTPRNANIPPRLYGQVCGEATSMFRPRRDPRSPVFHQT
jgi:hypothetical protein